MEEKQAAHANDAAGIATDAAGDVTGNATDAAPDAASEVAILVIKRATHEILFFNDKMREYTPAIKLGDVCYELWHQHCPNCPLFAMEGRETHAAVKYDAILGKFIDFTVTRILWQDTVPAFHISLAPHTERREADLVEIHRMYAQVLRTVYFTSVRIDFATGRYESYSIAEWKRPLIADSGEYELLLRGHAEFFDASCREEMLRLFSITVLREYFERMHEPFEYVAKTAPKTHMSWVRLIAHPCKTEGCDRYTHAILLAEDVSRHKAHDERIAAKLRDALKRAEAASVAKSTFLSNMSHDIRTPMNAILGYARIALRHKDDHARVIDHVHKIITAATHLQGIINNVLDMSRIEAGKETLHLTKTSLKDFLSDILPIVHDGLMKKGLHFRINQHTVANDIVYIDIQKINQVFVNLFSNATKFTPEGGTITMKIERDDDTAASGGAITHDEADGMVETVESRYVITFSDTGKGMSKAFCKRIFEPFAQEFSNTETGFRGTGLGMAIVQKTIEMMGGTIEVDSELGVGTTFTIRLPLLRPTEASEATARDDADENGADDTLYATGKQPWAGARILLVEDLAINRDIAKTILEDMGCVVAEAVNGKEAVERMEAVEDGAFDLVFMDLQMPIMDGYEATRAIRQSPRAYLREVPIVALTANTFKEDVDKCHRAGMSGHIAKPLEIQQLQEVLTRFCTGKENVCPPPRKILTTADQTGLELFSWTLSSSPRVNRRERYAEIFEDN